MNAILEVIWFLFLAAVVATGLYFIVFYTIGIFAGIAMEY